METGKQLYIYEIMNPSPGLSQEEEDLLSGGGFLLGFYHYVNGNDK